MGWFNGKAAKGTQRVRSVMPPKVVPADLGRQVGGRKAGKAVGKDGAGRQDRASSRNTTRQVGNVPRGLKQSTKNVNARRKRKS